MLVSGDIVSMSEDITLEVAYLSRIKVFTEKDQCKCEIRNLSAFSFARQVEVNSLFLTANTEECIKNLLDDIYVQPTQSPERLFLSVIEFGCQGNNGIFTVTTNIINGVMPVLQVFTPSTSSWYTLAVQGVAAVFPNGSNSANYKFDYDSFWDFDTLKFRLFDQQTNIISPFATCTTLDCSIEAIRNEDGENLENEDGRDLLSN